MDRTRQYTQADGTGWDKFAASRPAHDARFYADGNTSLDDLELELLGDVAGRSLLHLACANGNDTLSWAALGAAATGVDISAAGIAVARHAAAAAGLDAAFLCADIYDLPATLPAFDIVYMSGGGICWMPDLDRWAQIVAAHLVPGGTAAIVEHHPLWEVLTAAGGKLTPQFDYFGRQPHAVAETEASKRPAGWRADAGLTSFIWPVGDVLDSLSQAGLRVTHFAEHPVPAMYAGLGPRAAWLRACYSILAGRPG